MNILGERPRLITAAQEYLPPSLSDRYRQLSSRFINEAEIVDPNTGFIKVPFMNRPPYIDNNALVTQADILAHFFRKDRPTRIIGIPTSGLPLARSVAQRFPNAEYVESIKVDDGIPIRWNKGILFSVYSFSRHIDMPMCIQEIEPGEQYLVIDDVSAHGNAAVGFISELMQYGGDVVGFGVGFAKEFQGGIHRVIKECNVNVASVITIARISKDNRVILT